MSASSRSKAFPAVFSFIVNYFSTWGRGKVVAPRKKESPADSGPPPRVFRPEAASPSRDTPYQIAYDLLKAGWRRHQESVGRQLEATVPGKPFLHVYAPDDDPWSELNQTMASCLQGMEGDLAVEIQDALKKGSGLRDAHRFNNHLVSRYERSIWDFRVTGGLTRKAALDENRHNLVRFSEILGSQHRDLKAQLENLLSLLWRRARGNHKARLNDGDRVKIPI